MENLSLLQKLAGIIDGKIHEEKEVRLKLKALPPETKKIKPIHIRQGVLKEIRDNNGKLISYARIRERKIPDEPIEYSLGIKNWDEQEKSEAEISKDTFDVFFPDNVSKVQDKNRYVLDNGWLIDDMKIPGVITAEFEYKNQDDIPEVPKHWETDLTVEEALKHPWERK